MLTAKNSVQMRRAEHRLIALMERGCKRVARELLLLQAHKGGIQFIARVLYIIMFA